MLRGHVNLAAGSAVWEGVGAALRSTPASCSVSVDLGGVESIDGATMAMLAHLRAAFKHAGGEAEFVHARGNVATLMHLYGGDAPVTRPRVRRAEGFFSNVGRATAAFVEEVKLLFAFIGELSVASAAAIRHPRVVYWRDLAPNVERTGSDAIPVVLLINFLIGFVTALQSSVQLRQFGATIYVADLVGVASARELAPLMTAIIVCGRTGAAIAAQLGSMTVSEEIDALRTMGIGAMPFLVIPRLIALVIVLPMLTLLADTFAVVGGMVVGIGSLDLTITSYLTETQKAVHGWDILSGLGKSVLFGLAIVAIAAQQGLAARGGAEGVGRRTTAAVVGTLFAIIVIDAAFTMLMSAVHL